MIPNIPIKLYCMDGIGSPITVHVCKDIRDVQQVIAPIGVRSALQANCHDHNWHPALMVCTLCGMTAEEFRFGVRQSDLERN